MNNAQKILQTGLWSTNEKEVESLVGRIEKFNLMNIGNAIKLDIIPYEEGDEFVPDPHYKLRLLFPSKEIQMRFWTT